MAHALIALGSNLGDREANLAKAVEQLKTLPVTRILRISRWIETAPVGGPPQGKFLNGAAQLDTELSPQELLKGLQAVEVTMGRPIEHPKNNPRVIDLDLLSYNQMIVETSELTLPHPRLHERMFVLEPLSEIAPDWTHPILRKKPLQMIHDLRCGSSRR